MTDDIKVICLTLNFPEPSSENALTQEDVWGKYNMETDRRLSDGMIIARHEETCPHFLDIVPYRSITVRGPAKKVEEISYWLEYVHGSDCIQKVERVG